jgi:hypothetical protein
LIFEYQNKKKNIMKTFQLVIDPKILVTGKADHYTYAPQKKVDHIAVEDKTVIGLKTKTGWFDKDAPQNLTYKGAGIRGILVVCMPALSAIDWYLGTHTMIFIAPLIMYLAVTALTMTCPVKALFCKFKSANLPKL